MGIAYPQTPLQLYLFFISLPRVFLILSCLFFVSFLVADTQLYKMLCPSVGLLVRWCIRDDRVEPCENAHFWNRRCDCLCVWVCVGWVWMGVVCPYPLVRNDIVTPCHLFFYRVYRKSQNKISISLLSIRCVSRPTLTEMRKCVYWCLSDVPRV